MKMKACWLILILLISSCAHRKVVDYSGSAKTTSLKIAESNLQVTPLKRVSLDSDHDVIMLKFQVSAQEPVNKVMANDLQLTSEGIVHRVLNDQELKTFAAQEEGHDTSLKKGFPIGATYNQGKLLNYLQEKRLVERRPSSSQQKYFMSFS